MSVSSDPDPFRPRPLDRDRDLERDRACCASSLLLLSLDLPFFLCFLPFLRFSLSPEDEEEGLAGGEYREGFPFFFFLRFPAGFRLRCGSLSLSDDEGGSEESSEEESLHRFFFFGRLFPRFLLSVLSDDDAELDRARGFGDRLVRVSLVFPWPLFGGRFLFVAGARSGLDESSLLLRLVSVSSSSEDDWVLGAGPGCSRPPFFLFFLSDFFRFLSGGEFLLRLWRRDCTFSHSSSTFSDSGGSDKSTLAVYPFSTAQR